MLNILLAADSAPPLPTTGEKVNAMIDNLNATGNRLMELPLFMSVGFVVLLAAILFFVGWRIVLKNKRPRLGRGMMGGAVLLLIVGAAFIVDQKVTRLQRDVSDIRSRSTTESMALLDEMNAQHAALLKQMDARQADLLAKLKPRPGTVAAGSPGGGAATSPDTKRAALLFDMEVVKKTLGSSFADLTLRPLRSDESVNIIQMHSTNPLVQAYIGIVDLKNPSVTIKLGANGDLKTLTSDFAKTNNCTLAINGEAGDSPAANSGLGLWRGNLMVDGKVLMTETADNLRPFLSFNKNNEATFTAMGAKTRGVPTDAQNVIWGRMDALVDGVVQTADERLRQPRTAMGLSKDNGRLILLVVDGRQQNYSVGFMRAEVGQVLKAFGADNGMLCDEGGSSCMFIKPFGIANAPSDGQERQTYTHFGVIVKGE